MADVRLSSEAVKDLDHMIASHGLPFGTRDRVRRKLEPHLGGAVYIHSARGFGYRFEKPAAQVGRTASVTRLVPSVSGPRLQAAAR